MAQIHRRYLVLAGRFVAIAVGAALWLHVVASFAVAAYTQYYYQDRMFDVRRYPGGGATLVPLTGGYMASMVTRDDNVLLGSSFSFAVPFDVNETVGAILRHRGIRIRNVSVIGLGVTGMNDIACAMVVRQLKARTLIIEIPWINEVSYLSQFPAAPPVRKCAPSESSSSMFHFALTHPIGLGWLNFLFDPYRGKASPEKVALSPIPKGYYATLDDFARIKPALRKQLAALYHRAKSISPNVLLFVTPVYLDGVARVASEYHASVGHQFSSVQDFCKKLAAENCIDTTSLTGNPDYFANMTHFKQRGSEALAALIARRLSATERR